MDGFEDEPPNVVCSHFLACHTIWYDNTNPDAGWSLVRVIIHIRPSEGQTFPFAVRRLFLFAQLHGVSDEYIVRVRFVRVLTFDEDEQEEEVRWLGPWEIALPGDNYVECYGFPLYNLPLAAAGVYEFQLWVDGFDEPIARERFEARD
jgi:hypothetical protein